MARRGILGLTSLSLWITAIASLIALFSPFWISYFILVHVADGIYLSCTDPYGNASCYWQDANIEAASWETAWKVLWITGTGLMLFLALSGCCLCSESCQNSVCSAIVCIGTFLAGGMLVTAVILFGVMWSEGSDVSFFNRSNPVYFDWAYYAAIIAAGSSILSSVLVICSIRSMRDKE